ncbi:MAG: DUF3575 domain-containing protein [Muribaculaceae bacterium]|nr:DUF3575 domain-containing protein [Muribaculaceae bacterium]
MRIRRMFLTVCGFLMGIAGAEAQEVALKTNLVGDLLLSPNAALEVGLAHRWTAELSGQFNLWSVDGHRWRHWVLQPEARYWLCRRFQGHFFGVHLLGGEYNMSRLGLDISFLGTDLRPLRDHSFEGWGIGGGLAYGYAWAVHPNWNIEAEIGIGYIFAKYREYPCAECGTEIDRGSHNYVGPTKAALNLVYVF